MKLSLNWIREYADLPANLTMDQLAYDLTMRTVEVEGAENPAEALHKVVTGTILAVEPHPNADQLRVCQVDIGTGKPSAIVCGGTNLRAGQIVVVAVPGAMVKWHGQGDPVEIKATKLRGVESQGMICAAGELGLEDLFPVTGEREIMDLTGWEAKPGTPVAEVLGLNDFILEIDNKSLTNRPDLWGHYGIARELAAIYGVALKPLPALEVPAGIPAFPVDVRDTKHCRRYAALVCAGLQTAPSPYWLQLKIWKVGMRPINNLVDITNCIMLATGQPTHGFDRNHIDGGIVVRPAQANEKLELLDGTLIDLNGDDLLIASETIPVGLAGIMGGKHDSILPETTEMVLELANFDPLSTRRTTQRLGVRTEASVRYEKSIDTQRIDQALGVAGWLLRQVVPTARIEAFTDIYPVPTETAPIDVPLAFLNKRLGRELTPVQVAENLERLGFGTEYADGVFRVQVPSWRGTGDVAVQDDILEEVARMIGYENFSFIPPQVALTGAVNQRKVSTDRAIREYLAFRCGMQEIFTYPWLDEKYIEAAGIPQAACLSLATPPSPETAYIRPSLIPGMLESIAGNVRYFTAFRCFELTQVFRAGETHPSDADETLPLQERYLAASFVGEDALTLFREAKGVLEQLPRIAQVEPIGFGQVEKPAWADSKAWLNILVGDAVIGSLGVLSLKATRLAGIKRSQAALLEVNVEKLQPLPSRQNHFEHLPQLPLVEQDLSILIADSVKWTEIEALVAKQVARCEFIGEYRGVQVPAGKKSLTFRVWLDGGEKTLTAEEIEPKMRGIVASISEKLGGEMRG